MRHSGATFSGIQAIARRTMNQFWRYQAVTIEGKYGSVKTWQKVGLPFAGRVTPDMSSEALDQEVNMVQNPKTGTLVYVRDVALSDTDCIGDPSGTQLYQVIGATDVPTTQAGQAVRTVKVGLK